MWQDKIKEIIYLLDNSDVNEIDVTFWGRRFRVVKSPVSNYEDLSNQAKTIHEELPQPEQEKANSEKPSSNEESILSPMPGTFYSASSRKQIHLLSLEILYQKVIPCVLLKQ